MKKIFSIILCMSLCIMTVMPVSAAEVERKENTIEIEKLDISTYATNSFSKILPMLRSINGEPSKVVTIHSGSISGNEPYITSIEIFIRVNSACDPFSLCIQAPDGTIECCDVAGSRNMIINFFNGYDPAGDWKIWIVTKGAMSTANITVKVNYSY